MTTLNAIQPLLDRLFAESDTTRPALHAAFASVPAAEQAHLMQSKTDYLELYTRLKDFALPVSPAAGQLLYMLVRSSRAENIVEFGTSLGISTLHLAAALRDNGGGRIIGSEFEPGKIARARAHIKEAGFDDLVEIREGDALQTLSKNLPERIDLLLLDGAKGLYLDILALVENRLRVGAIIIADNADHSPAYLARVRGTGNGYLSLPFGDDVELSVKVK